MANGGDIKRRGNPNPKKRTTPTVKKVRVVPGPPEPTLTAFHPEAHPKKIGDLALLGLTNDQIASVLDISPSTLSDWIAKHESVKTALYDARVGADAAVVNALRHRALGYAHQSEELKVVSVGDNGGSVVERHTVIKQYPPSEVAAIFWLKNRHRDLWRNDPHAGSGTNDPQEAAAAARAAILAANATVQGDDE